MAKKSEPLAEEATPVEEMKTPQTVSVKQLMKSMFIIILSLLCVVGGLLIYQLHTRLEKARPILPGDEPEMTFPEPDTEVPLTLSAEPAVSDIPVDTVLETTDTTPTEPDIVVPTPAVSEPTEPAANVQPEATLAQEESLPTETPAEPVEAAPLPTPEQPYFTLQDALALRDHLYRGEACRSDFQKLLQSKVQNGAWHKMIEHLTPVCAQDKPLHLHTLFRKERKQAVIMYYQMNNPWWLAYLKAIPATLVEVRRLNPTTQTPMDLLSAAENALLQDDIQGALQFIQKLPQPMQAKFTDFKAKADLYLAAQNEVSSLILSFERKGK